MFPEAVRAQDAITVSIERHARPTSDGGVVFEVRVACGPLPGSPDVRQGFAGAAQARTGAEAEGGLSPDVICDGVERVYIADLSPITEASFARGPADANASVIACNVVDEEQVCVQGSAQRRIIIAGRASP